MGSSAALPAESWGQLYVVYELTERTGITKGSSAKGRARDDIVQVDRRPESGGKLKNANRSKPMFHPDTPVRLPKEEIKFGHVKSFDKQSRMYDVTMRDGKMRQSVPEDDVKEASLCPRCNRWSKLVGYHDGDVHGRTCPK